MRRFLSIQVKEEEQAEEEQQPLEKTASKVVKKPASKAKAEAGSKPKVEKVEGEEEEEVREQDESVDPDGHNEKRSKGCWEMQADNPSFRSWLKTSDKGYGKDAQTTFPHAIMLHHSFHCDADAFNQALASGDIAEVNQGGKAMYSFDTYESGRAKESEQRVEKYLNDICESYWKVPIEAGR
eukprot:s4228_g1.t1